MKVILNPYDWTEVKKIIDKKLKGLKATNGSYGTVFKV